MPRTFPSLATGYKPSEGRRASSPPGWIAGLFEFSQLAESGWAALGERNVAADIRSHTPSYVDGPDRQETF